MEKCPKCSGVVKEQVSIKGFWFWKRKIVTHYCTLCDFNNSHQFKISGEDKRIEIRDRESNVGLSRLREENTKTRVQNIKSDKSYEYSREG